MGQSNGVLFKKESTFQRCPIDRGLTDDPREVHGSMHSHKYIIH